jgi:hypothetical protein
LEGLVLDIVLGVSIAPTSVQMVVVEGENADGALVEEDGFDVAASDDTEPTAVPDRVISAILGTREGAIDAGLELSSIGVTWTDQLHASVLRDALAAYKLENVMLVSAFLAAAALGQSVGGAMGYDTTAVLFVEPETATLAVVETSDGSITAVYKEQIVAESYDEATAQLTGMISWLDEFDLPPGGVFVVGSGVDVGVLKPALESATSLTVSAPEEPATALARGAALASANAPLFASSTAALAYAQDPGTGAVHPDVGPEYLGVSYLSSAELDDDLAYSLVADEDADAPTIVIPRVDLADPEENEPRRRPVLLLGSGMAVIAISAVVALEIALAIGIRTTDIALQPTPNQSLIVPAQPAPAAPLVQASAPRPKISVEAPVAAPKPLNPPVGLPRPAAPIPAAPPPLPAAPAPVVPVPVVMPPVMPVPVRVPAPNWLMGPPVIQAPPRLVPPLPVVQEPPPVQIPKPQWPEPRSIPQSPPHQTPPESGPPNPNGPGGLGGWHVPPPGSGSGGANGGGPGHGGGPLGGGPLGGGPLGGGPIGGGPIGGGPIGGGPIGGGPIGGGPIGGGPLGGGPLGGGPLGGGHGGGPIGGGPLGGGHGGGGPIGGGPIGGGPIGGGPLGGGHGGGPIGGGPIGGGPGGGGGFGGGGGGFGGGGHSGGGFGGGGGGGHSSGGSSGGHSGGGHH